jgi:vacuolar-type H+-ATPase subunit C/Vma6
VTRGLEAAAARAQGLTTQLVPGATLSALADCTSLDQLAHQLESWLPGAAPDGPVSAAQIETWSRAGAAHLLRVLTRWLQLRRHAAEILLADEQQRALRRIVRGILTGQPVAWRLQDVVPTPALPARALELLAQQPTLERVVATLIALRNPFADALATMAGQARADPFPIDLALFRAYLSQNRRLARRAGREFRQHLRNVIDTENLLAALVIAERPQDVAIETMFLEGGQNLSRATFQAAAQTQDANAALRILRTGMSGWIASALHAPGWSAAPEATLLRVWLAQYRRLVRLQPLGLWQPALFLLRLRAQLSDVRRLAWGIALQASPLMLREQLVSV